jgi:hypothetical protein
MRLRIIQVHARSAVYLVLFIHRSLSLKTSWRHPLLRNAPRRRRAPPLLRPPRPRGPPPPRANLKKRNVKCRSKRSLTGASCHWLRNSRASRVSSGQSDRAGLEPPIFPKRNRYRIIYGFVSSLEPAPLRQRSNRVTPARATVHSSQQFIHSSPPHSRLDPSCTRVT